jgi:hypothetical protein
MRTFIIICLGILIPEWPVLSQSQGPLNPGTKVNNILGGSVAWVNPNNVGISDNSCATATNGTSNILIVSNFGFSIPATANITGITTEIERKGTPINSVSSSAWTTFTPTPYVSGTATTSYGATSYSYNLPFSSATNNKRLLVVTIGIENVDNVSPSDPSITFGTVTYNGVAMTLATSNAMASATTSNSVAVYYLKESGLPSTTGSRALVINKTVNGETAGGTISPAEFVEVVGVCTYIDVDQATPISSVSQTSPSSPINAPAINNIRNGDYIIAATMNNTSAGGSVTPGAGYTENFEVPNNNGGTTSGAILEVQSKSLAGITGTPSVVVSATAVSASRLVMGVISVNSARTYDNSAKLMGPFGVQVGNNMAITPGSSLPNAWPDVDTYQTYGNSSDMWGTALTPADINNANFGFSFQADAANSIASIDHIRITIYYSIPLKIDEKEFANSDILNNEKQTEILIYPNPVNDYLFIESGKKITSINLWDALGNNIDVKISVDGTKFKMENMPGKGFFTLVINTETGIISKKIIVN